MNDQIIESHLNLFLTGFMGSGKSTVGELLAQNLQRKFFDLDQEIEDYMQLTAFQVIEKFGEEYFRKIEAQKLAVLCSHKDAVISLGGGTLISEQNLKQVQKSGRLIYLMAQEDVILSRLKKTASRPLLQKLDHENYEKLFLVRMPGYSKADLSIQTGEFTPDRICSMLLSQVKLLEQE